MSAAVQVLSRERLFLLLLLAAPLGLWVLIFVAVPPTAQEFPLNDDWAYSKGLFAFARGEGIHYYRQPSMPLLGQWILAVPFVRLVGESHVALRLVTIALSLVGVCAFYDLLRREAGRPPDDASFTTAAFVFNPLYFLLSGTFMSDVPSLALSLASLASYARALRGGRLAWLAAGVALAILAVVNRQNAIVTPLVFGLLLARDKVLRRRGPWILGALLPIVCGVLVNTWFGARSDAVPLSVSVPAASQVLVLGFTGTLYLGLAALPILAFRPGIGSWWWFLIALVFMLDGVATCFMVGNELFPAHAFHGGLFPYLENMITPWGTLESGNYVVGDRPLMIGRTAQVVITAVGCVAGAELVERTVARLRGGALATPLLLFSALHVLILLVSPTLYDRYLIVLVPGALAVASGIPLRVRWKAGLVVLVLFAAVAAGLMHDWFAWNSARWELGRRALARGMPVDAIEGGLEWDSWYAPGPVASKGGPQPAPRGFTLAFNRGRFPHISGRYALAFSQPKNAEVLDSQPYRLWLVPGQWDFLLVGQLGGGDVK
ncbi:MAG: glycosyltransferase family 39 protein [Isosphaeraceae bacterium]|nr:glycosyltransferase family 39 protein [Isosphaeraceae bacterium]